MSQIFVAPDPAILDPIAIDAALCNGCNLCVHVCPVDLFLPNAAKGQAPHPTYPGECWYEGSCVDICPVPGAIRLNRPPAMRVRWKEGHPVRAEAPRAGLEPAARHERDG